MIPPSQAYLHHDDTSFTRDGCNLELHITPPPSPSLCASSFMGLDGFWVFDVSFSECNRLVTKSSDLHWNMSIEIIHMREGQEGLLSLLENFSYGKLLTEKCDSLQSLPRIILGANCLQELTLTNIPSLISFPADGLSTSLQLLEIS
ncbi:hypothetical protein JHK82_029970 [Glycine max]|nr:hypothetical protein JHK82_029970 [Glycine max]